MYESSYFILANNAALLLAMVVIYDTMLSSSMERIPFKPYISGIALGLIGVTLMATPMMVSEGVMIDSRSILLSATGFFFGLVPTAIAVVFTVVFRLYEGGQGALAGIVLILFSAGAGLSLRYIRRTKQSTPSWKELYLFGLFVHSGVLLSLLWLLPASISFEITISLALPMMLIFPVVSVLLCRVLGHQQQRRFTELALKTSQQAYCNTIDRLKATLHAVPDALYEMDLSGRYCDYRSLTPTLAKTGFLPDLSEDIHQLMPGKSVNVVLDALRRANTTNTTQGAQVRIPDKGKILYFELSIAKHQALNDESPRFVVLARNITERKKNEQELHIAATAFNSQEGMMITDTKHRILRVNNAFTEVTGYTAEEAVGNTPSMLSSGRHEHEFYERMMQELQSNNVWQGEIWNQRKNGEIYPEWLTITAVTNPNGDVTNYVGAFTDITQRKQAEADIHLLAFYDSLTGLPNRRLLLDRLEQSLLLRKRRPQLGALMFIDLDNFKTLNDTQGHDVGDKLLIEVARRLKRCVREVDTVARLGGDEFIIILEELNSDSQQAALDAEFVAEKIVDTLNCPYPLDDGEYVGTASIGISLFDQRDTSAKDLLKRADVAMYQAKESGRNTLRFFDPTIQQNLYLQAELEKELRQALKDNQFELYYQAQTCDGQLVGAEALLRWHHPVDGLISPAGFIARAEQCGLIIPLGYWVLEAACNKLKTWEAHPALKEITLSVNVSAQQFGTGEFIHDVKTILERTGVNPKRLRFEITESSVLIDIDNTANQMANLKELGISFAIDDFGTGYSSLFHLKHLPVDQLKIDRSFIRNITEEPDDLAIVQAIIAMAHNLGIGVIAEGVETESQRNVLSDRDCLNYQGFLFGKPLPAGTFEQAPLVNRDYEIA